MTQLQHTQQIVRASLVIPLPTYPTSPGGSFLDERPGVKLVAHLPLDYADEVGADDSAYARDDGGNDLSLSCSQRSLDDGVDNKRYVVDSRDNKRRTAI